MVDPFSFGTLLIAPLLGELAKDALKDYIKDFFQDTIAGSTDFVRGKLAKDAVKKALEAFDSQFQQELKTAGLDKKQIRQYAKPLQFFLKDDAVKRTLGKAFEDDKGFPDVEVLATRWKQLTFGGQKAFGLTVIEPKSLPFLPQGFDWLQVAERYRQAVLNIVSENQELTQKFVVRTVNNIDKKLDYLIGVPADFDLIGYRDGLLEQYQNLDLSSLDARYSDYERRLTLPEIFIAPNARECQEYLPKDYELPKLYQKSLREKGEIAAELTEEELERYQKAYRQQSPKSLLEILDDDRFNYLVVLGDPGSGKSTLLRYLALQWANLEEHELAKHSVPLLIELRKFIRESHDYKTFVEYINNGRTWIGHLNQTELHDWLQRGRAIALFDGLDEVFDKALREQVISQIHDFTQDYPKVEIVVTSRIIGYEPHRLKNAEFRHVMLQDFEPEQVEEFVNKWHDLTFTDRFKKASKQERLEKAIRESAAIRELAGNPLLLTLMAILNRNQELPRNRAKLYEKASEVLLYQWDFETKEELVREMQAWQIDTYLFDLELKQEIVRKVAYRMQSRGEGLAGNIISREELRKTVAEVLGRTFAEKSTFLAKEIIDQLRERNFILCLLGGHNEEYYGFVHRTFLEFFCAWELVWQFKEDQTLSLAELKTEVFGKHWQDEAWQEVLRLIAGMITNAKFVGEVIEFLIAQSLGESKWTNLFPVDLAELQSRSQLPGESEGTNLFLAADCLAELQSRSEILETSNKVLKLLKKFATRDGLGEELSNKAITAIATTWKGEQGTLTWLRSYVRCSRSSYVPESAVSAIAREWKEYPQTLPWLKLLVFDDEHWAVRRVALQELAIGWKQDAEIFELLCDRAINDPFQRSDDEFSEEEINPRQTALEAIVEHFSDRPQTLPLLRDRATNDPDEQVREFAQKTLQQLQELAQG